MLTHYICVPRYANNATNVTYNLSWCPHHLGKYVGKH